MPSRLRTSVALEGDWRLTIASTFFGSADIPLSEENVAKELQAVLREGALVPVQDQAFLSQSLEGFP